MQKEDYFNSDGCKIFFRESIPDNIKDPLSVIFIHGYPLESSMWDELAESLKDKYHLISYDIRGLGKSSQSEFPFTFEFHVNDLFTLIAHLNLKKVIVLGLSIGGYIALRAYEKNSKNFTGLILSNTQAGNDSLAGLEGRFNNILKIRKEGKDTFAEGFLKNALSDLTLDQNKDIVEKLNSVIVNQNQEGLISNLVALATRSNTTEVLSTIKCPVLFICGENDRLTPCSAMKEMAQKTQNSDFELISGAGHFSPVENPKAYNKAVLNFLLKLN